MWHQSSHEEHPTHLTFPALFDLPTERFHRFVKDPFWWLKVQRVAQQASIDCIVDPFFFLAMSDGKRKILKKITALCHGCLLLSLQQSHCAFKKNSLIRYGTSATTTTCALLPQICSNDFQIKQDRFLRSKKRCTVKGFDNESLLLKIVWLLKINAG